jgi:predicted nucleic acid-binding protein
MRSENNKVFVDSNYFVALFNPNDALYQRASIVAKKIDAKRQRLVLSNYIFLEVTTVLSQRRGRDVSIAVGSHLMTNPMIDVIHVDETLHEESWKIFQNIQQKDMSFVDCSTLAIMRAEQMDRLLTFDLTDFRGLQREFGFKIFPK